MYNPNLASILFYDQPLSISNFDDVMPTSRIAIIDLSEFRTVTGKIFRLRIMSLLTSGNDRGDASESISRSNQILSPLFSVHQT